MMEQNETGYYSEDKRDISSVEMLCGDKWGIIQIFNNYVSDDELRSICRYYANRNPGVDYRFRHGSIHFAEEFEIVKGE